MSIARVGVLLITDQPVVAAGLASALAGNALIGVTGRATSTFEAARCLSEGTFDVALVALAGHVSRADELLRAHATGARPAWIVLSASDAPEADVHAARGGAAGYLATTVGLDKVVTAIRFVAAGGSMLDIRRLRAVDAGTGRRLTPRDRGIVRGLLAGRTNDEIGSQVGLGRKAVEAHLTHLYRRFGVGCRTELALRAEREEWLDRAEDRWTA